MKRIQIYTPEQFKESPYITVAEGIYARTGAWPGDTVYVTALRLSVFSSEQRPTKQPARLDMFMQPDAELEALLLHFCLLPGEIGEETDVAGKRVRFIVVMGRSLADMRNLMRCAGKSIAIRKYACGEHICERLILG